MTSAVLISMAIVLAVGAPVSGAAQTCENPRLAALTPPPPPESAPPDQPYDRLDVYDTAVNLGMGQLRPIEEHAWGWTNELQLPLFRVTTAAPFAWLQRGWVIPAAGGTRQAMSTAGMVETGYEAAAFVVLAVRDDGWTQIRFTPDPDGVVWTHTCFFADGPRPLAMERWEDRLLSSEISPLFFRAEERHPLRAAASADSPPIAWIPADPGSYALRPREIVGSWMRVEVTEPSDYCLPPEQPPERHEGWVQWRDDRVGPRVWYYTRGC